MFQVEIAIFFLERKSNIYEQKKKPGRNIICICIYLVSHTKSYQHSARERSGCANYHPAAEEKKYSGLFVFL